MKKTLLERFKEKINSEWKWIGGKTGAGYGQMRVNGIQKGAHVISYELFIGPVPDGLWVLHSCDDPACVRPEHLHAGTASQNSQEREDRGRRNTYYQCKSNKKHVPEKKYRNYRSKLNVDQVIEIRRLLFDENLSQVEIAKKYNVTKNAIWNIAHFKTWRSDYRL